METYIREGQYSRLPDLPYTPGSDASGYVVAVAPGVTGLKVSEKGKRPVMAIASLEHFSGGSTSLRHR